MSGIAPHDFENHHPRVTRSSKMEAIESFRGNIHGGIETDRAFGCAHIVVDGFWNTD